MNAWSSCSIGWKAAAKCDTKQLSKSQYVFSVPACTVDTKTDMHTSQPEPVMTSFRPSKSDSDEADDSTHKESLPKNTWMRVAEFAYEENCSIEEAITRCGVVDHVASQSRTEAAADAQSESSQGETAMSRLRRMQNRLSSFVDESDETEQEESSTKEDAASRLERAKACLADLSAKKESTAAAPEEKKIREDTGSSIDLGEMISGHDTLVEPDAISDEEHTEAKDETSLMDVREVLSDYETLLGMMPEETNAAEEDANGGPSMFDIAEQSSNS